MGTLAKFMAAAKRLAHRERAARPLVVPEHLNRNSARVSALMPPEQAGLLLLERMRERLGLDSYAALRLLDFGCGVRFTQAIVNTDFAIGAYAGVDNSRPVIDFLSDRVRDPRLTYHFLDARHPLYNPDGAPLSAATRLPLPERSFDVVCLFSVITHQVPDDARAILTCLRRYVAPSGHLFFTCFLDDAVETFEDRSPEKNGGFCLYNRAFLHDLVVEAGWHVVSTAPSEGPLIQGSCACRPGWTEGLPDR